MRTLVLAVDSRIEIQFVHLLEKPMCCRISKRKGQATESNAFVMSIFRSSEGSADHAANDMPTRQHGSCRV
jgi:hypothetical protein